MKIKKSSILNRGGVQISKIYKGSTLLWENWKYQEGNLISMTSNNQNGYTASCGGWSNNTNAYYAFDGKANSNTLYTNNPNETASDQPSQPYVKLIFPKPIRIVEIKSWIGYGAEALTYSRWFHIFGIKEDGTEVDLGYNNSGDTWGNLNNALITHSVSASNQAIPFVGIIVKRKNSGNGWYYLGDIQITKWYSKS